VKNGTTSTGKPYWKISISDLDDKLLNLNYFGYLSENLKRGSVYIAPLFKNNGWINIPYGQQITKAS
jgi:hypothetical protein